MSISTGVIGNDKIKFYKAFAIGIESIVNLIGSNFKQIKFNKREIE